MTLILSGTDGLSDVDGSAATPAIRGTDANTGIFFPAADTIAFSEGGVESMRINASGNVGIGTISPGYRLDVRGGNARIAANASGASDGVLYFGNAATNYIFGGDGNNYMTFGVNNAERMRIDSSGNLTQTGVTTASGLVMSGLGTTSSNTTVNSSTYNVNISGSAKVFWVSLGSGDGCLVVTNYLTTTITIIGTVVAIAATASPSASQLGISKSANSHVVTFKTGSAAATQFGSWSVSSLSSIVS